MTAPVSSGPSGDEGWNRGVSWSALWLGLLVLAAWSRWPEAWLLAGVPLLVLVGLRGIRRAFPYPAALASVLLVAGSAGGFAAHLQLRQIQFRWEDVWSRREARAASVLTEELDRLLRSGEEAVADLASRSPVRSDSAGVERLRELRGRHGLAAMALYGPDGDLEVWDGTHRGPVPSFVRAGSAPYAYGERPLFSYLYFTSPVASTGGTAVAAALLRVSLPPGLEGETEDFATLIRERTGEELRISRAELLSGESVWDLRWEDRTLFSVSVTEPTQGAEREAVLVRWSRIVLLLVAAAWLLLAFGTGGWRARAWAAGGSLVVLALVLPLGSVLGLSELASPTSFLLAPPLDATLLRTVAVAFSLVVLLGVAYGRWRGGGRVAPGLAVVGVSLPLLVVLFRSAPSAEFLAGSEEAFVVVQGALALVLTLAVAGGLLLAADPQDRDVRTRFLAASVAGAAGLGLAGAAWVAAGRDLPAAAAALWVLPAAVVLRSPGPRRGWLRRLPLWAAAAVVGGTCALPFAWEIRLGSRMEVGESELERLATPADPYTEFLLQRFTARVDTLAAGGAGPVELLYGGWVESGMAREGMPAWLTLWSAGNLPLEDLRLGLPPPRPTAAEEILADVRAAAGPMIRQLNRPDARYVAAVPLASGEVVTAMIPPSTRRVRASPLEPLFAGPGVLEENPLTLVPLLAGDVGRAPDTTRWVRTGSGWRGERMLELPDGRFHALYTVRTGEPTLLAARGSLLLSLNLAVAGLLFGLGVVVASGRAPPVERLTGVVRTFRGRVTLALFAFFLLSVALFGALGYRTLSGASVRTAAALAERVADEAAGWYLEVQGSMDLLARRVGADLLEYREGRLVGGSVTELVELGLYEGWLPYDVHRRLGGRETLLVQETSSVGAWSYAVTYRRLPDGDVLGAPVPLQAGAAALRRRELTDLLGFGILLGAGLSLGLAFLVGRTLARPIRDLRQAAGRVGRGDLGVRLPGGRSDEFGVVFSDFNRMVQRLRRARRDLVRTTRRTRAIVEEAATGVVALDGDGRVTLVNPRAEELLQAEVHPGQPLPDEGEAAGELADWLDRYFRHDMGAAGTELHDGERRIRVQARRITGREGPAGVVLSLEDVTDELRTERILAWGEMAQQVAHEVKNPLTPIKLSVQHILRAWEDRRGDFGGILERNVEAMLREIDRLDAIARSFSRFAAPRAAGMEPLQEVSVSDVVTETLDLYAADEGDIRFEASLSPELPPVRGRPGELKEVLLNLLENARSAIEGEGTVRIEAEWVEPDVVLRVRDDGQGIPEELLPRIFEPHFSTRSSGTGLGLAIVRRLVNSWGGRVSVRSREGEGTTVRIVLPTWDPGEAGDGDGGGGEGVDASQGPEGDPSRGGGPGPGGEEPESPSFDDR